MPRDREPLERLRCRSKEYETNPGKHGPPGKAPPAAKTSANGPSGNISVQNLADPNDDFFAEQLSPILGRMLANAAIVDHLNNEHETAATRLKWLHQLLDPRTPRISDRAPIVDPDNQEHLSVSDDEFESLRRQVVVQAKRIALGLDAFGNSPSFVPMVSFSELKNYANKWLEATRRSERAYSQYYNAAKDQEKSLLAAKDTIARLDSTITNLSSTLKQTEDARKRLQDDIAALLVEVDVAAVQLLATADSFQNAVVAKAAGGCQFGEIVKVVGSFVALAKGGVGLAKGIGPLLDAIGSDQGETDFSGYLETISKKFRIVEGEVKEVVVAYKDVKALLAAKPLTDKIPGDAAKIAMKRAEMDALIEKFRGLAEAKAFRAVIDNFLHLSQIRNGKIVEHDTLVLQAASMRSEISNAEADKVTVRVAIAKSIDPFLPTIEEFMQRSFASHKVELIRAIYYAQRALAYLTLTSDVNDFETKTIAGLEANYNDLEKSLFSLKNAIGGSHQIEKIGSPESTFSIRKTIGKTAIKELRKRRPVTFTVPDDAFPDSYHMYATKLAVEFVGLKHVSGSDPALDITHSGRAIFHDAFGDIIEFVHDSRRTRVRSSIAAGVPLRQGEDYIPLTPYGPWTIVVDLHANRLVDFSKLKDVILSFEYKFLPS